MKWNEFIFRLKIFGWYLLTEPIKQFKELVTIAMHILEASNKTLTIGYLCLILTTVALFLGKRFYAGAFIIILLFVVLLWEWERGFYMKCYRDKVKKRIEKEVQKNG